MAKNPTQLTALGATPAAADLFVVVDVSDTTHDALGTSKKVRYDELVPTSSATVAGVVELATTAETTTGSDATRSVTPAGLHGMTSLAGKTWFLDEDDMASDSATKVPSQQSVKAYVDEKFANSAIFYNVKDYGVVGDGSTDDTAAIEALLDDIGDDGGIVFFPPGEYLCNITIEHSNIQLLGVGHAESGDVTSGTTLRPYTKTSRCITVGNGTSRADHVKISNMSIRGYGDVNTTDIADGVKIQGAGWFTMEDIFITYFRGNGLLIESTASSEVFYAFFTRMSISWNEKAAIKCKYGSTYVTTVTFSQCHIQGNTTVGTSYVLDTEGVYVRMDQVDVDYQLSCGLITRAGSGSVIEMHQTIMDAYGGSGHFAELLNCASTETLDRALFGSFQAGGASIKYSDAVTIQPSAGATFGSVSAGTRIPNSVLVGVTTIAPITNPNVDYATHAWLRAGSGSPEGVYAAPVGSLYLRLDGSTSTTLYVKTSGTGNTGWTAK